MDRLVLVLSSCVMAAAFGCRQATERAGAASTSQASLGRHLAQEAGGAHPPPSIPHLNPRWSEPSVDRKPSWGEQRSCGNRHQTINNLMIFQL